MAIARGSGLTPKCSFPIIRSPPQCVSRVRILPSLVFVIADEIRN